MNDFYIIKGVTGVTMETLEGKIKVKMWSGSSWKHAYKVGLNEIYVTWPILGEILYLAPHSSHSVEDWYERLLVVLKHSLRWNMKKKIIFKGPLRQCYLPKGTVWSIGTWTVCCVKYYSDSCWKQNHGMISIFKYHCLLLNYIFFVHQVQ